MLNFFSVAPKLWLIPKVSLSANSKKKSVWDDELLLTPKLKHF